MSPKFYLPYDIIIGTKGIMDFRKKVDIHSV